MKKHTRFWLMVLVTFILLLALSIPALAKKEYQCNIQAVTFNRQGIFGLSQVYGELYADWVDDTLYNTCTGIIPFGDQTLKSKGWWYADLDQTCDYWGDNAECAGETLYSDEKLLPMHIVVYDPITGDLLPADTYNLTIFANGDFVFNKEYTP